MDQSRVGAGGGAGGGRWSVEASYGGKLESKCELRSFYLRLVLLISQHRAIATMKTNLGTTMRNTSSEIEDQIGVMMTLMP